MSPKLALSSVVLAFTLAEPAAAAAAPAVEVDVEVAVDGPAADLSEETSYPATPAVAVDGPAEHLSEETSSIEIPAPAPAAIGPAPEEEAFELPEPAAEPEPSSPVPPGPHFVVANYYGVTAGVSPAPSFDQTLFLGRGLRARAPAARRLALGYSFTLSLGLAERYSVGLATTRHHFTANFHGGRRQRLFTAVGGGFALFAGYIPSVVEVEGRIGYLFGRGLQRRAVGVVGALARVGWDFRHRERAPMPQLGVFVGFLVR